MFRMLVCQPETTTSPNLRHTFRHGLCSLPLRPLTRDLFVHVRWRRILLQFQSLPILADRAADWAHNTWMLLFDTSNSIAFGQLALR